ncbi:MAG: carboxypeptidase regulatory-like domain-containing protein [Kofleriaceae bacterium]|nr:carboxypeptidase regulatory-like domain-containing protein [Kofleriaceae bacterium]
MVVGFFLWSRGRGGGGAGDRPAAARDAGAGRSIDVNRSAAAGIEGVVVDVAGKPVAGAIVRAVRDGRRGEDDVPAPARAGADGRFALEVTAGAYLLTAAAAGHAPARPASRSAPASAPTPSSGSAPAAWSCAAPSATPPAARSTAR